MTLTVLVSIGCVLVFAGVMAWMNEYTNQVDRWDDYQMSPAWCHDTLPLIRLRGEMIA